LAIRQSVKVLPHVAQLVTPSLRYVPGPKGASLVFIRPDDNQLDTPGGRSRGASARMLWSSSISPTMPIARIR
jgi:hypothetical protein